MKLQKKQIRIRVSHCSQVLLLSGLDEARWNELSSEKGGEEHLHFLIKFVTLRRNKEAIAAIGGTWDKDLDGGDPATSDAALIRTAIRQVLVLVG